MKFNDDYSASTKYEKPFFFKHSFVENMGENA